LNLLRHPRVLLYGIALFYLAVLGILLPGTTGPAGLEADFGVVRPDGARETVLEGRGRGLWFPHASQLLLPYLESWDTRRWGFPREIPVMDIVWTGVLSVPGSERRAFGVEGHGQWEIEIGPLAMAGGEGATARGGGPEVRGADFEAGQHPVRIHYRGSGERASFRLFEVGEEGRRAPAREGFFPGAGEAGARRFRRLALFVLLFFPTVSLVYLARRYRGRLRWREFAAPARHVALAVLVLFGLGLRLHDVAGVPCHNETADEYYHAWAGRSLLHGRGPEAWSWDPVYPDARMDRWFGVDYRIVSPWLDQPPLFTLTVGAWDALAGALSGRPSYGEPVFYGAAPLAALRILSVLLFGAALVLVYHLGRRLTSRGAGFAAALLFASTPMLVPLHRLVKAENLVVVLALAVVLLALAYRESPGRKRALAIAVLCALAPLVKVTAFFVPLTALVLVGTGPAGSRREGVSHVVVGTAAGVAALLVYAAALDWNLFWAVTRSQASKPLGILSAARLVFEPRVVQRPFGPAWVGWLWLAAVPALVGRGRWLALPLFLCLLSIAGAGHRDFLFGWYAIPFYPFLAIAAGGELVARKANGPALFLFWILFLGTSFDMVAQIRGGPLLDVRPFLFLGGVLLLVEIFRRRVPGGVRAALGWILLGLSVLLNAAVVMNLRFLYG
jgi:hypothetical protein